MALSTPKDVYLFAYTLAQLAATGYVLYLAFSSFSDGPSAVYAVAGDLVRLLQTLSLLEVMHAVFGLVRSNPFNTLVQISSRVYVVWFIINAVPSAATKVLRIPYLGDDAHPLLGLSYATMVIAWGFAETIRYTYYACSMLGSVPYFVKWVRYTAFYVLYPLGISSELTVCYFANPTLRSTGMFSYRMPNAWNFDFDFAFFNTYCVMLVAYVTFSPMLYTHMMSQRKKALGGAKAKKQ